MKKSQMRGYLYEIFISHFLNKNGFIRCRKCENGLLNGNIVSEDGEISGRGTNHQIDFVGIYTKNIPFVFPMRLLAECKFWNKSIDKSFIRQYIGVYKDISENYISSQINDKNRFLDIPIIFSASDFDKEAANLAWAQGINTVSHSKLPILRDILEVINAIVDNLNDGFRSEDFNKLKKIINDFIFREIDSCELCRLLLCFYSNERWICENREKFNTITENHIKTFLFATTNKGTLINLISKDEFPDELFLNSNTVDCAIYFEERNENNQNDNDRTNERLFYVKLNQDRNDRKFYFQVNDALLDKEFPNLSLQRRIRLKSDYFTELSIIKEIRSITRIIKLKVNFADVADRIR